MARVLGAIGYTVAAIAATTAVVSVGTATPSTIDQVGTSMHCSTITTNDEFTATTPGTTADAVCTLANGEAFHVVKPARGAAFSTFLQARPDLQIANVDWPWTAVGTQGALIAAGLQPYRYGEGEF